MSDWMIVGLGNPGVRYAKTRHNLGFLAVKALGQKLDQDVHFRMNAKWQAELLKVDVRQAGTRLGWHLFLPMTYMNCCGPAIERYRSFYNIPVSQVVILVDDVALPFGQMRFRSQGSAGGHNGLKSIQQAFGTQDYPRLRMGIGEPTNSQEGERDLADYVLAPFLEEEFRQLPDLFNRVIDWVLALPTKSMGDKGKQESPLPL